MSMFRTKSRSKSVNGTLLDTPKHSDLIYDVGMHKGEDAEFYLRKGFRVVGFEADPDLTASCRQRLAGFIDGGQLTIIEGAIVKSDLIKSGQTKVRFYKNTAKSIWGTASSKWAERNVHLGTESCVIEVDAVDFAEAIRAHGMPYFMKIDIEGNDLVCINSLSGFLARPSYVSFESDKTSFRNIRQEIDLLGKLGYKTFKAVEQSDLPKLQSPPYPAREGMYVAQRFETGSSGLFGSEIAGRWKSRKMILWRYRFIRVGYILLGDDGFMNRWRFPGSSISRWCTRRIVGLFTRGRVPGWYDTHARHCSVDTASRDK